jgi:hypothetical protein
MTRKKRWFIKATGSVCYDLAGINFPMMESLNFEEMLSGIKNANARWVNQFACMNQPTVLTFSATEAEARQLTRVLPVGLTVVGHLENEN